MRILKALLLLLVSTEIPVTVSAQQKKFVMPDTFIAKMRVFDRKHNAPLEGMILPEFTATLEDGRQLSNASLRGKVSLLLFWYPTCNCFRPDALGSLPELVKQYKDFQIVSIMSDTSGLALFRSGHSFVTTCANVYSEAKCREMNGGNGFPSCVLVSRAGNVARISGMLQQGIFDEQAFADKIRELLMF